MRPIFVLTAGASVEVSTLDGSDIDTGGHKFSNISDGPSRFVDPSVVLPRANKVVTPLFSFPYRPARFLEQGL